MKGRTGITLAFACFAMISTPVFAAKLPAIKVAENNAVPQCATPGRLVAFLKTRNAKLNPRYEGIGTEYMRYGEELGVRWDIAFFQMMLETGNLTYTGDVKAKQNNFAGLGATGRKEPGESFKDIASGVHAHLQHVLMYTGENIEDPVAERTRLVQEWGVLTKWRKSIKGPMTFAHLARQWAPGARNYARDIGDLAESFYDTTCNEPDPRPELVAEARKGRTTGVATAAAPKAPPPATFETAAKPGTQVNATSPVKPILPQPDAPAADKNDVHTRAAALAATLSPPANSTAAAASGTAGTGDGKVGFKLLNTPSAEADTADKAPQISATAPATAKAKATPAASTSNSSDQQPAGQSKGKAVETASLAAGAAKNAGAAAAKAQACRVWTASYGGTKAVIVKAVKDDLVNYTVLDVNEGAERRETAAYIAAYAKGGEMIGEFTSQNQALDKAFELCPEG